ncbi:MAG: hypothetical protein OET44_01400 [Gammaproteobacteria bacterium]|nr:hypothetical protein [Gammaproteobacteria bacterium]
MHAQEKPAAPAVRPSKTPMTTTFTGQPGARRPPFRTNHAGNLLRPTALKQARERLLGTDTAVSNLEAP